MPSEVGGADIRLCGAPGRQCRPRVQEIQGADDNDDARGHVVQKFGHTRQQQSVQPPGALATRRALRSMSMGPAPTANGDSSVS